MKKVILAEGTFHQTVESEGRGSALKSSDMKAKDLLSLLQEAMSIGFTKLSDCDEDSLTLTHMDGSEVRITLS